jgi:hypothetical protein
MVQRLRGDGRTIVLNQTEEWIQERIAVPWTNGDNLILNGEHWDPRNIRVVIRETKNQATGSDPLAAWNWTSSGTDRTNELLDRPAGSAGSGDSQPFAEDRRKVMVVLGRNSRVGEALFTFLRAIDLHPLEWTQLVGSTPDDVSYLRQDLIPKGDPENEAVPRGQARPNVFYEAGMAMGRFPTRTIFVEAGTMRPASDLGGMHAVRMDEGPECRKDLANRLEAAGCQVNTTGSQWLTTGNFSVTEVVGEVANEELSEKARLIQRIDAFMAELSSKGYASMVKGHIFNNLVDEAGVNGVVKAKPMSMTSTCNLTETDMRMILGQVKLQI